MVATACLFFACKVEEQPRRLREFVEAIHKTFHKKSSEPSALTTEVSSPNNASINILALAGRLYRNLKTACKILNRFSTKFQISD